MITRTVDRLYLPASVILSDVRSNPPKQGGTINCRVVISLTILEGKLNLVKIYEI